jgi:hypothetical protein
VPPTVAVGDGNTSAATSCRSVGFGAVLDRRARPTSACGVLRGWAPVVASVWAAIEPAAVSALAQFVMVELQM